MDIRAFAMDLSLLLCVSWNKLEFVGFRFERARVAWFGLFIIFFCVMFIVMGIEAVKYHKRNRGGVASARGSEICYFWMEGRCERNPCRFLHGEPDQFSADDRASRKARRLTVNRPREDADNGPRIPLALASRLGGVTRRNVVKKVTGNQPRKRFVKRASLPQGSNCQAVNSESYVQPSLSEDVAMGDRRLVGEPRRRPPKLVDSSFHNGSDNYEERPAENKPRGIPDVKCLSKIRSYLQGPKISPMDADAQVETLVSSEEILVPKSVEKPCEHWMSGGCIEGDSCKMLHAWYRGSGFSLLTKLGGHDEVITGIGLSSGCDKLFTGSYDGTMRIWDCQFGQSLSVVNLGAVVGSLICEGPWVFIGIPNVVKVFNAETNAEFTLQGPIGQVYSMIVALDMLFAGSQDGAIVVWKGSKEKPVPFQLVESLKGHTADVICLAVGPMKLYSGSSDCTIRIWDLDNLQCVRVLNGHVQAVKSLLFCNQYVLSCSLDKTIKVWATTDTGDMEATTYTHVEEHGVIALCGIQDGEAKPILLCSRDDNCVHLYELPSFADRGMIFSKREVRTLRIGPNGLFFTGDGSGAVSVWKMGDKL